MAEGSNIVHLVGSPRKAWDQQIAEPDWEYSAFVLWLMQVPRKSIAGQELAKRYDWSERAIAFDNHEGSLGRPKDLVAKIGQQLLRAAVIETESLLRVRQQAPIDSRTMSTKDLKDLLELYVSNKDVFAASEGAIDQDMTKLSEVELRVIQAAHQISARAGRK